MIYLSSYDTTVGQAIMTEKLIAVLKQLSVQHGFASPAAQFGGVAQRDDIYPVIITPSLSKDVELPIFAHPLMFEGPRREKFVAVDARMVLSTLPDGTTVIRNETEFEIIKNRLKCDLIWLAQGQDNLAALSSVPCGVYAMLIAESLTRRFYLNPQENIDIAMIASFFYQMLFIERDDYVEEQKQKMAASTMKAIMAPAQTIFQTIDLVGYMENLNDLCLQIQKKVQNIRLKDLNPGLLLSIMMHSWYGLNGKDLMSVGLEHPPTWMVLVNAALESRSFKNSPLAKVADRFRGSKGAENYMKAFGIQMSDADL